MSSGISLKKVNELVAELSRTPVLMYLFFPFWGYKNTWEDIYIVQLDLQLSSLHKQASSLGLELRWLQGMRIKLHYSY